MSSASVHEPEPRPSAVVEMSTSEAEQWEDLTLRLGTRMLPELEALLESLPSVASAMVTTPDGFNLCAVGLSESAVDRVAAMGSALHSVASAATGAIAESSDEPGVEASDLDLVTLSHGALSTVVLVVDGGAGPQDALLWVTGLHDTLGALIFHTRACARRLSTILGDS